MSRSGIVFVFNLNLRVFNLNLCVKSVFSWRCFTGRRTAQDNRNRARHWATLRALLWRDDPEHGPGTIVRRAAASDQQARHGTAMGARFLARLNNKQHLHELSADCCPLLERRHGYSAARTRWFPTWSQASVYTFSRASNWSDRDTQSTCGGARQEVLARKRFLLRRSVTQHPVDARARFGPGFTACLARISI